MPPPRLAELLRQRALLSQHLAWLDAEIAAAQDGETPALVAPNPPPTTPHPAPVVPTLPVAVRELPAATVAPSSDPLALANQRADEIIAQHSAEDRFDPAAARRGCIWIAVAVGVFLFVAVIAIYLLNYRA